MPAKAVLRKTTTAAVPFAHTQASLLLDVFRAAAALIVVLEHSRNMMLVDYTSIAEHRALWLPLYALCAAGHQAVIIFFVLSGYLVGGSALRGLQAGTFRWPRYLTHRLVRLWLVLIPGLLLTYAADRAGIASGWAPAMYAGQTVTHMLSNVTAALSLKTLAGNAAFLQTIRVPTLGSNGALWSLANEFWYYILFPLGCLALLRYGQKPLTRVLTAVLFAAITWFIGWGIVAYLPIWIGGAWLATLRPPRPLRPVTYFIAGAVYAVLLFGFARANTLPLALRDYLLAVATIAVLYFVLALRNRARTSTASAVIRTTARFSFSLYIIHTPLVVLAAAYLLRGARMIPTPAAVIEWAGTVLAIILVAWLFAACTEFHTDTLRARVERTLGFQPAKPKLPADPALDA